MHRQLLSLRVLAWLAGMAMLAFSGWASADPPSRVARLGYVIGAVGFSPAGENDWTQAAVNRPLTTGDRLWAEADARAEVQVGGTVIRLGAGTGVALLNLDDRIAQWQLTQGVMHIRVRRLEPGQVVEVDTPNLALTLRQPGDVRIEVDPYGDATTVFVRQGAVEVAGEDASYAVDSRQPYRFTGTGLRDAQPVAAARADEFDLWARDRDRAFDISVSARYVSPDVVGYQDLDAYGTWRVDVSFGNVWVPSRVAVGWAPYRDGHWVWVDPWGWTWVDDAPWGFAVTHYGRWANLRGIWVWVPGPVRTRAYYAPALVVFIGGDNFRITLSSGAVGGVAWFPLAPREVYRPTYPVSRAYFENVNVSNTVINTTIVNNYYNETNITNVVYANRRVPGAVVAVPKDTFEHSRPVAREAVRLAPEVTAAVPVALAPRVAPTERSVRGAAAERAKPPARVFERPVIARTEPPAARPGFAQQQPQLAANPGKPLDDAARKGLRPAPTAPAPVVKVVPQPREAPRALPAPTARKAVPARPDSGGSPSQAQPAVRPGQRQGDAAPQPPRSAPSAAAPVVKATPPAREAARTPSPPAAKGEQPARAKGGAAPAPSAPQSGRRAQEAASAASKPSDRQRGND